MDGSKSFVVELPFPPSVNRYWRSVKGRVLISRNGRDYIRSVAAIVRLENNAPRFGTKRLSLEIVANCPDRRLRDLDNICKAVQDSLQKSGVYDDDSQIDRLTVIRGKVSKPGRVVCTLEELPSER